MQMTSGFFYSSLFLMLYLMDQNIFYDFCHWNSPLSIAANTSLYLCKYVTINLTARYVTIFVQKCHYTCANMSLLPGYCNICHNSCAIICHYTCANMSLYLCKYVTILEVNMSLVLVQIWVSDTVVAVLSGSITCANMSLH